MPGFDGTGPEGRGPLTGRGLGPCGSGRGFRRGHGRGFGRGFGSGFGRGFGRRRFWGTSPHYQTPYPALTKNEERAMLEDELKLLEEDIKSIKERIKELEK